jgi:Uma2 family endonuclease
MPQTKPLEYITPEEYEAGERLAEFRHEYIDGQVFAMAGASEQHNRVAENVFFQLRSSARGTPCGVFMSDMRIRIRGGERYYYPDVALVCDPNDDATHHKENPCLISEVLSNATNKTDRREKWQGYRTIPGLRYYLLIDSRQPLIDYFHRLDDGNWEQGSLQPGETLEIDCGPGFSSRLDFDEVYEDIVWRDPLLPEEA